MVWESRPRKCKVRAPPIPSSTKKSPAPRRHAGPRPSSVKKIRETVEAAPSGETGSAPVPPSQVRSGGRGTEADSGSASQAQSRFRPKYGDPSDGLQGLNLWSQLSGTVFVFTKDFQKKVQWDSLDTQTQQQLTAWAPKAKDHLASSRESQAIFEGWLWRILVDRVFTAYDQELWDGYGDIVNKIEYLATIAPARLTENQKFQGLGVSPNWRQQSSDSFKYWYYEWRSMTATLVRSASEHRLRFSREFVVGRITQELGPFFRPQPGREARFYELLDQIADAAIGADALFQGSPLKWDFDFTDPETGKAFGFAYQSSNETPRNTNDTMMLQLGQSSHNEFSIGLPVDHVVQPLVRSYNFSRPGRADTAFQMHPMAVFVDFYGPEAEEHYAAVDRQMEEAERQFNLAKGAPRGNEGPSN